MKTALRLLSFCFLVFSFSARADTLTFVSPDVPMPIPDGPSGIARSHLTVPVNREILDLNITVTINHTFDGDLGLYLEAPGGDVVRLAWRCGQSGNNYTNTTFDDEAGPFICDANPPFTSSYRPDQPLEAFDGLSTLGQWEFRVTDNAAQDTGSIQAWQVTIVGNPLGAGKVIVLPPASFQLTAYPNPFNPSTTISFSLPRMQMVNLSVYDMLGREVARLAEQVYPAGEHQVTFRGTDLPSGIYFARLTSGSRLLTHKLLHAK